MSERIWNMMRDRRERVSSTTVFKYADRRHVRHQMSRKLKKFVREVKLNDRLHFHSLRHTFATWLVQRGVPIFEVQKLLGHAEISTTMVYAHLAPSELHSAVNKIQLPDV